MKKILICSGIFALFILFTCSNIAFSNTKNTPFLEETTTSEYIPIPKHLSKQYKKEMEQIINKGYPIVIKNIDNYMDKATVYYNNIQTNGYNIGEHVCITNIAEISLPAAELDLYSDLIRITKEKYLGIKYEPIGTDSTIPIDEFLYPYFKDNKINSHKLVKITEYENKKIKLVKKYLEKIQKLVPTE